MLGSPACDGRIRGGSRLDRDDRSGADGRDAGVEKLVLVHRGPGLEGAESEQQALANVSAIFGGEVVLANELDVLDI